MEQQRTHSSSVPSPVTRKGSAPLAALQLDVQWIDQTLTYHIESPGAPLQTVTREYTRTLSTEEAQAVEQVAAEIRALLQLANFRSAAAILSREALVRAGRRLYLLLLPEAVRSQLASSRTTYLLLRLDDRSVVLPWEVLHDGSEFLALRYRLGRLIRTLTAAPTPASRPQHERLRAVVITDPAGNLHGAAMEGEQVYRTLSGLPAVSASLLSNRVTLEETCRAMVDADLVHYCGHAVVDAAHPERSGWLLADQPLVAAQVRAWGNAGPVPRLVFCNACHSGETQVWSNVAGQTVFGLAHAFLAIGVQHYIGTIWEVLDEPSTHMAAVFYEHIAAGTPIGAAFLAARTALAARYGEDNMTWASYVLYGDPRCVLCEPHNSAPQSVEADVDGAMAEAEAPALVTRAATSQVPARPTRVPSAMVVASLLLLLLAFVIVIAPLSVFRGTDHRQAGQTLGFELLARGDLQTASQVFASQAALGNADGLAGQAALALAQGELELAAQLAERAYAQDKEGYANLVLAELAFRRGETTTALDYLNRTLANNRASPWQQAQALALQARLADAMGDGALARAAMAKAVALVPNDPSLYAQQAALLERAGDDTAAASAYQAAAQHSAATDAATLWYALAERSRLRRRNAEQDRALALLAELEQMPARLEEATDPWTTLPRRFVARPFSAMGAPSRWIAEDELLQHGLVAQLSAQGLALPVERQNLADLLFEHRLGRSAEAEPGWEAQIGRLLAARVLLAGEIIRTERETTLFLRLIDVSTSSVPAQITHSTTGSLVSAITTLAPQVAAALRTHFPLRGRILSAASETVEMNLGRDHGVQPDMAFRVFSRGTVEAILRHTVGSVPEPVATLRVRPDGLGSRVCRAVVTERSADLVPGMGVEEY